MSQSPALVSIEPIVNSLERRRLDTVVPPEPKIWGALDGSTLLRVAAQARFWEAAQEAGRSIDYEQYMEDLITGVHGIGLPVAYLILGNPKSIGVYVGLQTQDASTEAILRTALEGTFPGIELAAQPENRLGTAHFKEGSWLYGRLTGIPTRKTGQAGYASASKQAANLPNAEQIERLLRGLFGSTWGYLVRAAPKPDGEVVGMAQAGFGQISTVKNQVHVQISEQQQTLRPVSASEQQSSSRSVNRDQTDRQAEYCVELLERQLDRLNRGKAQGMWLTDVFFFATDPVTLAKVRALLRAIFGGADSTPEPIRTFACAPNGLPQPDAFSTLLNSGELATLCQLPKEEFPGYALRDYARFDTDLANMSRSVGSPIRIGQVMDGARPTGDWFVLDTPGFAKHGLIAGVTGSGKTNTIFYLLDRLRTHQVPFLVIEPAKAEYRQLRTASGFDNLRVYTLGDETVSPLRLNPFEFEINARGSIHVQTHIDYLKSVFNAAFVLYAPMPYVLDTCLHEIYQDKGWDLTSGHNRRVPPDLRGQAHRYPVFPTLSDLYRKIDEVVDRLGYEERIQMDVKAGLKARIGSLRLGSKGLMLDTPHGVPFSDLLSQPTVLELERMGNDDEKAFLIGLVLTRLYEYRWVEARSAQANQSRLRHVVVIEEAHRLLKNVSTEVGTEEANTKGQAVETFSNMLSEIRAYGQGVLIAEQIPTKLAPDAIKNTNLKLAHRIVAEDDRQVLGATMNLDESQQRVISTLRAGQVVAYAEGADHAYLLNVPDFKRQLNAQPVGDAALKQAAAMWPSASRTSDRLAQYLPAAQPVSDIRDYTLAVLNHAEWPAAFSRYCLSLIESPRLAVYAYPALLQVMQRAVRPRTDQAERAVAIWVMVEATLDLLHDRGRRYGWFYTAVQEMSDALVDALVDVAANFENNTTALDTLAVKHTPVIEHVRARYLNLIARAPKPYAGCDFCTLPCRYRYEAESLAKDKNLQREFVAAIQQTKSDDEMWSKLAGVAREGAHQIVDERAGHEAIARVAVCLTAQIGSPLEFSVGSQRKMVKNVKVVLTTAN